MRYRPRRRQRRRTRTSRASCPCAAPAQRTRGRGSFSAYLTGRGRHRRPPGRGGLVPHRDGVVGRRRRGTLHFVDPQEERHPPLGREYLRRGSRERADAAPSAVAGVAVAPTPDPVRGDEVVACVVRARDARRRRRARGRWPRRSSRIASRGSPTTRRRAFVAFVPTRCRSPRRRRSSAGRCATSSPRPSAGRPASTPAPSRSGRPPDGPLRAPDAASLRTAFVLAAPVSVPLRALLDRDRALVDRPGRCGNSAARAGIEKAEIRRALGVELHAVRPTRRWRSPSIWGSSRAGSTPSRWAERAASWPCAVPARAVQAGDADVVACVAGGTRTTSISFRRLLSSFSRFAQDAAYPYGFGGPNASFALLMDAYMREYGATREDFGKDRRRATPENARAFPHALMKSPLTLEAYLAARPIADPIALYDCVMPCAGAEAFLVTTPENRRRARPAHGVGARQRSSATTPSPRDPIQLRGGWAMDAGRALRHGWRRPRRPSTSSRPTTTIP